MADQLHEFKGKRILAVEDDYFLADDLRGDLESHGATVIGPVSSVNEALALIESGRVDAAILDIELDAETSYPVAFVLDERNVPFVFVTGASKDTIPEHFSKFVLGKPSSLQAIGQGLFGLRPH